MKCFGICLFAIALFLFRPCAVANSSTGAAGGAFGLLGQVDLSLESSGYESAWPATPAVGLSYSKATGEIHYRHWSPERMDETYTILPRWNANFDHGYAFQVGARLGQFRVMTRLGTSELGYGMNLSLIYYPWMHR